MKRKTKEEFILKARQAHGWKYDYSKVEYVNQNTKVCIICPEHGEFWQRPSDHLKGCGCKKCSSESVHIKQRNTREKFILRAYEVHGDTYDYSKVEYVNNTTKVCIICPEHGEFWQTPDNHLTSKHGCPKCGGSKKLTTQDFIEKARKIHGDKYDYSKVNYVNNKTKVCIICPEHGEFCQKPNIHLGNHGCPKCKAQDASKRLRTKLDDFISQARQVHGDKYDYSKVEYKNTESKVCIICSKHGEFWQTPHAHLSGCGCPKCSGLYRTTVDFINEAKEIHGDKYDYSLTNYIGYSNKVCIICPEHGEFCQKPISHLRGQGCPNCKESKLEKEVRNFLIRENINFEAQKRFDWLGWQSLDFFLPDYSIAIECQGEQHFKPIDFGGKGEEWANKLLIDNIARDNKKLNACNEHNIKILYYSDINSLCITTLTALKNKIYENRN